MLLILDDHTSCSRSVEVLDFCKGNNIVLLYLPSHTIHYLRPLDRSFFKPLNANYYAASKNYVKANPNKRITRFKFGNLLGFAWNKSGSMENGISKFRATRIAPYNPETIPYHTYIDMNMELAAQQHISCESIILRNSQVSNTHRRTPFPRPDCSHYPDVLPYPR